jgi:hypothetical protein
MEATKSVAAARDSTRVQADVWGFGFGLTGQLGNGRWTHNQPVPTKLPAFSGLYEYDEPTSSVIPIRLAYMSVGAAHAAAVMDNVASVAVPASARRASAKLTPNDTNWGRDILFWGNNEFYQLGTGKRANAPTPTYIQPLDQAAETERERGLGLFTEKREREMHRFQITPRQKVKVGGRNVEMEQRVACGRGCTAVFSAV